MVSSRQGARSPLVSPQLKVIQVGIEGNLAGGADLCIDVEVRYRLLVHLDGVGRISHFTAVVGGDPFRAPNQVETPLIQRIVEISVVAAGGQEIRLNLIVDGRNFGYAQPGHRLAVESAPIRHQIVGLVVDSAVGVHAPVVNARRYSNWRLSSCRGRQR